MESEIESELEGYFESPEDASPRWLLMLRAYLDESGQESKDLVVIAGFVGNKNAWTKLLAPWKSALGARESLHMSSLRFNLKKKNVRELLQRLAPIPVSCGLTPICGGIRVSDYEHLLPKNALLEKLHSGYISSLFPLLTHVLTWLPENERVEFIFEQQDTYSWLTDMVLGGLKTAPIPAFFTKDGKPKLAKWGYVPKGSTPLTEPADFLAYTFLQHNRDPKSLRSQWCKPLQVSVDSVGIVGHVMTKQEAQREVLALLEEFKNNPKWVEAFERINQAIARDVMDAKKNRERV